MKCFALYRLPYAETYVEVNSEQDALLIDSYEEIGRVSGFVVAAFDPASHPTILIRPTSVEEKTVPQRKQEHRYEADVVVEEDKEAYQRAFTLFHDKVTSGSIKKLVLSRKKTIHAETIDGKEMFFEACRQYPRLMIMLVSTPQTGTWIVATPEKLLTGDGSWWRTMALAGTMPYVEGYQEWSMKNRDEQHYVETYIEERLRQCSHEIIKDGPHTQRAGNLVHLCTDFRFRLDEGRQIGEVISSLHPTPAVCGLPKAEAQQFIKENEGIDRSYYSGFMGPVGINAETHLYVTLRCAQLSCSLPQEEGSGSGSSLYAGGGILPESTMQSEWEETQQKMKTIGNVLK